ncbi:PP2C family serine/threonine-protein phosphatase [Virgisporangium ochraceum]|uniref:PP2C family serine/threonine-protein phosphatase n=1 Tax=Virgisporangium ochraceum TaxID=65505 RepID=UPI0019414988|nr:protein phosphatase 2C domain-containing protein [Virgisporangium ochraceum]
MAVSCPSCAAPAEPTDRYCEACGARLGTAGRLTSALPAAPCTGCGSAETAADGFCDGCGRRRPAGRERTELELPGVAAATDRGHRRRRNEDAVAIGRTGGATVAVVCDGISTSTDADTAATVAVGAAVDAVLVALDRGADPAEATRSGFAAARAAVAGLATDENRANPPSCTYVSGVVTAGTVTVGWAGDSRAYWLPRAGPARPLTEDDSLGAQLAAAGVPVAADAGPDAAALTRWVGADAGPVAARVATVDDATPGRLVLCSDGLSRYLADADRLAALAGGQPAEPPTDQPAGLVRRLVRFALDSGGGDNIAVAVLPFPIPEGGPYR